MEAVTADDAPPEGVAVDAAAVRKAARDQAFRDMHGRW
jgi:hypothetical protein